jgi:hypothetical protein
MRFGRTNSIAKLAIAFIILLLPALTLAVDSQNQPDPDAILQRIRNRVAEHLAHLPSYTCSEVVDRWLRRNGGSSLDPVDRVKFEVAFVGNREYFAPLGGARFEEGSITKMVPGGTIGNGAFGGHVTAIFDTDSATYKYVAPAKKDGHKTYRYDFDVPQEKSHFLVIGTGRGMVGFKGSFWVDDQTFDLVRLELKVENIPSHIGVRLLQESLQYSTVKIGDSDFLLARKSEMVAIDQAGNYSLNMVRLDDCHEFRGDSVVTYGAPVDTNSADRQAPPDH